MDPLNKSEEPMRPTPCLSRLLLIVCLPLVWSCAAQQTAAPSPSQLSHGSSLAGLTADSQPDSVQASEDPELTDQQDQEVEADLAPPESEATASQEIKDLEKLGAWEEGGTKALTESDIHSDFPITINRQVEYYLNLFQNQQKKIFASWLARSGRYLPMMRQRLAEAGLPQDLVYLSMIESGFKPTAFSTARAAGLWQFMGPTASRFGLQVNEYVDERRDPQLSTQAAIQYLSELYSQFGNWYVAVAAYNAGEGRINCGLQKFNCDNFWDLAKEDYLALETKRYVPQLIAAIIIAKSPQKFGFDNIQYEKPLEYEIAKVPARTQLAAVAVAANTDVETLRTLNRHLSKAQVPPGVGSYELKMPVGTSRLVAANLARVHAVVSTDFKDHFIGRKDTLNKICAKYGINKITLLKANNLRKSKLIPGTVLRIPQQTTQYALLSEKELQLLAKTSKTPADVTIHTVKSGDTISQIATRYGTSAKMIASLNGLKERHKLRVGQQLTVSAEEQPEPAAKTSRVKPERLAKAVSANGKGREILAARVKTPAKQKEASTHYEVKSGDNLWTIAERFALTPDDLIRWNKLDGHRIAPGLKLVIKSKS
jgi:membrane-bound lytic murein transglycosylase D